MISCRDLTKRYGPFTAVDAITLDVPSGAICTFLGPNGAGKSTIVKMLTGLTSPTSGTAVVAGIHVAGASAQLKSHIGVLPENLGLFDSLTIEEHLLLTGPVYGLDRHATRSRTEELLALLDLSATRRTFLDRASHGMRKKTALAMALLPNPRVLFLDEPFEGIDPVAAETIRQLLLDLARRGMTVFLTSHILTLVERLATQIALIRHGRLVWQGALADLPHSLEQLYFEHVEPPKEAALAWLGSPRS